MFVVFESPFFRFPLSSLYVFYYIYIFIYVMANKIVYFTQYKINLVYTRDPRTHFIAYTWSFVNTMYNHKMLLLFNDIKITSGQKLFSFDSYKTAKIMLRNTRVSFMEKITERKSEKLWWNYDEIVFSSCGSRFTSRHFIAKTSLFLYEDYSCFVLVQHTELEFYSASSLKQVHR
jgi:hypothetical protein